MLLRTPPAAAVAVFVAVASEPPSLTQQQATTGIYLGAGRPSSSATRA